MIDHTKQALLDLKAHQQSGSYRLCPRCGRNSMKQPLYTNALSRPRTCISVMHAVCRGRFWITHMHHCLSKRGQHSYKNSNTTS